MKGQVYKAKINSWIHSVISLIIGGVAVYYLHQLFTLNVKPEDPNLSLYSNVAIIIGVVLGFLFWLIGISLVWIGVNKRNTELQVKRYRHHYNRCIDHFKNKEYDKIKVIHNNYLKYQGLFKPLTARIRFAYKVSLGDDLEKEKLLSKDEHIRLNEETP